MQRLLLQLQIQEKVDICLEHGADEGFVYKAGNTNRDEQKSFQQMKELTEAWVLMWFTILSGDPLVSLLFVQQFGKEIFSNWFCSW